MKNWQITYSTGETVTITARSYTMAYLNGMRDGFIIVDVSEI